MLQPHLVALSVAAMLLGGTIDGHAQTKVADLCDSLSRVGAAGSRLLGALLRDHDLSRVLDCIAGIGNGAGRGPASLAEPVALMRDDAGRTARWAHEHLLTALLRAASAEQIGAQVAQSLVARLPGYDSAALRTEIVRLMPLLPVATYSTPLAVEAERLVGQLAARQRIGAAELQLAAAIARQALASGDRALTDVVARLAEVAPTRELHGAAREAAERLLTTTAPATR